MEVCGDHENLFSTVRTAWCYSQFIVSLRFFTSVKRFFSGTSSSSSMLVTSMAEGTSSSSMLVMKQGAGSDAMAVSCGAWNQNIKRKEMISLQTVSDS